MRRLLFITLAFLLTGLLQKANPALACGGGGLEISLNGVVSESDVIVQGTVIETDDASKNLIIRVETYLKGSGAAYLLVYRVNPVLSATYEGRHYDTGCTYGGANSIAEGERLYFALRRLPNGAYAYGTAGLFLEWELRNMTFPHTFPTLLDPNGPDDPSNWDYIEVASEDKWVQLILAMSGQIPTPPDSFARPRLTPLLITTETGSQYVLPVDGGTIAQLETPQTINEYSSYAYPQLLETPPFCSADLSLFCQNTTPDGSVIARFAQGDEQPYIHIDYYPYLGEYPTPNEPRLGYPDSMEEATMPITLSGDAFAFSSTGEVLVVYLEGSLLLYRVGNQYCGCTTYGEFAPRLELLRQIPLMGRGDAVKSMSEVRWSADGTTMTYHDTQGVWVFDIFEMAEPYLLDGGANLEPVFLSTSGRYVAYREPNLAAEVEWIVLDRVSNHYYRNAIFSPDERYMVQINPPEGDTSDCSTPLTEQCRVILDYVPLQFEWLTPSGHYYAVRCFSNGSCDLRSDTANDAETVSTAESNTLPYLNEKIVDVAYTRDQTIFAVALQQGGILIIGETDTPIELDVQLDGEIVDLAWLPSLFYHEN